jgi:hypothetical protein
VAETEINTSGVRHLNEALEGQGYSHNGLWGLTTTRRCPKVVAIAIF